MACSRMNFTLIFYYSLGHHLVHSTVNNLVNVMYVVTDGILSPYMCFISHHNTDVGQRTGISCYYTSRCSPEDIIGL